MLPPSSRIQHFLSSLNKETLSLVDEFYDMDIKFIDPLVELNNRQQVKRYYERLFSYAKDVRFDFVDEFVRDQTHMVAWIMTFKHEEIPGSPVCVEGVSYIRFGGREGKAIYHRDYFDVGQLVYEQVPVLGGVIRWIKRSLVPGVVK